MKNILVAEDDRSLRDGLVQAMNRSGYKVQVAESVSEATLAPGEPTRNFILGIVTHPAYESDGRTSWPGS